MLLEVMSREYPIVMGSCMKLCIAKSFQWCLWESQRVVNMELFEVLPKCIMDICELCSKHIKSSYMKP